MGNVMAYSGLTTKIRAMQAKLLTQADYETISGFTDVVQVVEFLKTKPAYAVYMDQLELAHLHRGDIEKMLYQSLYNDYTRIFRFAGIDQKKFLKIYWKKYEVSVINYCLRIVFNHYDKPYDLDYKKEFFDKYSKLSIDKLITSTNIDELVDNLRGSEYYEALKPIRDSGAATLFDYDQALEAGKKGILRKIQRAFFKRCGNQDGSHEHSMGVPCEAVLSYASGRNLCTDASISFSFKYGRI